MGGGMDWLARDGAAALRAAGAAIERSCVCGGGWLASELSLRAFAAALPAPRPFATGAARVAGAPFGRPRFDLAAAVGCVAALYASLLLLLSLSLPLSSAELGAAGAGAGTVDFFAGSEVESLDEPDDESSFCRGAGPLFPAFWVAAGVGAGVALMGGPGVSDGAAIAPVRGVDVAIGLPGCFCVKAT